MRIEKKKNKQETSKYYKYKSIDEMQIKAIREKFEKGIKKKNHQKYRKRMKNIMIYCSH